MYVNLRKCEYTPVLLSQDNFFCMFFAQLMNIKVDNRHLSFVGLFLSVFTSCNKYLAVIQTNLMNSALTFYIYIYIYIYVCVFRAVCGA